jgi:hypothetical protein
VADPASGAGSALDGAELPAAGDLLLTDVLGACVAALDPALPGGDAGAASRVGLEAGGHRQVLVVLADGLGRVPLEARIGHAPVLRAHRGDTAVAHTIAPSTTAAAITAFATGRRPGATRMVGYSVLRGDVPRTDGPAPEVMNLLAFAEGVDPVQWQPCDTVFERLSRVGVGSCVVSPPTFANSGLTRAALRGARHVGAVSWSQRMRAALRELRAGTPLVYLYWSDIDHAGHHHGCGSEQWTAALEDFDAGLGALLRRLPEQVAVVLTADHGMVDTGPDLLIDLARRPDLDEGVDAIAGEARSVHVHARPGRGPEVLARWREILSDGAWILSPGEMPGVLGEGPGSALIGDALVFPRGRAGIVDSRWQTPASIAQVGVHGSLTPDEMLIPVVRLA